MLLNIPNLDYARLPPCDEFGPILLSGIQNEPPRRRATRREKVSFEPAPPYQRLDANDSSQPHFHLMKCVPSAYHKMTDHLSSLAPEAAGILLGPRDEPSLVTHFVPDEHGESTNASFRLDVTRLNECLKTAKAAELACHGIVHSHPCGVTQPSGGDLFYFQQLFALPNNDSSHPFFVPIFCGRTLHPYVYFNGQVQPALLMLV